MFPNSRSCSEDPGGFSFPVQIRGWVCLSWSWRSGVQHPSECPGHRRAVLRWPEGRKGEGIWEEAMQSLTVWKQTDVFIIMEKICWCLFAQRNTGRGNILLSSDQGCILKRLWAGVINQQKWEEVIFPDWCSNIPCVGDRKGCTASPGIFSQTTFLESWQNGAWKIGPRDVSPVPPVLLHPSNYSRCCLRDVQPQARITLELHSSGDTQPWGYKESEHTNNATNNTYKISPERSLPAPGTPVPGKPPT